MSANRRSTGGNAREFDTYHGETLASTSATPANRSPLCRPHARPRSLRQRRQRHCNERGLDDLFGEHRDRDSSTGDPSTTSGAASSGVDPATGADSDPTGSNGPRWEVTVSGGVNGTGTGVIVQVVQGGTTTVLGGDTDLSATSIQPADDPKTGEKRALSFDIDLDDGTGCGPQNAGDLEAYINVVDASEGAYDATFSGMLLRDGGVEVALSRYIRE